MCVPRGAGAGGGHAIDAAGGRWLARQRGRREAAGGAAAGHSALPGRPPAARHAQVLSARGANPRWGQTLVPNSFRTLDLATLLLDVLQLLCDRWPPVTLRCSPRVLQTYIPNSAGILQQHCCWTHSYCSTWATAGRPSRTGALCASCKPSFSTAPTVNHSNYAAGRSAALGRPLAARCAQVLASHRHSAPGPLKDTAYTLSHR